ncbi:lysophospholipid acyltransferase family protein [Thermoflavimicrobium daqui]|jgi:1-acyl-sn-glycerol-3-phosphate acyltransferase|uniref:1-acyl-sn-glycerol-3-phosphate acyltransferase n=1 Tax=Thermoflavimicrobium daqui TaxID=2137476 RepID=A0A364K8U2_9BACL|nr:lysophospholipid acyltransferase family protein [Thermoflavimicrobium daqui]RAL26620.1 1-acyl-sn-glycerol-3-phosphate acyltransferase [Thermoflavimicrobium daqui]
MYSFCAYVVYAFLRLFYRFKVVGKENLPSSGFVIACNHTGWLDILSLAVGILPHKVNYMAKKELFENRFIGWFLSKLKSFPVDRDNPGPSSLKIPIRRLKNGENVGIFPSGTRQQGEVPLKRGAVFLAEKARVPLVPASYQGPPAIRLADLFRRKEITVMIGKPIDPNEYKDSEEKDAFAKKFNEAFNQLNYQSRDH